MINIILQGYQKEKDNMARMMREMPPAVQNATRESILYVHKSVPPYPPKRPGQTYIRRMAAGLGGSITTEVRGLGIESIGIIGTKIEYAPWVISEEKLPDGRGPQAWMHVGRWWTLQGVVEKAQEKVTEIYEKWVGRVVRR